MDRLRETRLLLLFCFALSLSVPASASSLKIGADTLHAAQTTDRIAVIVLLREPAVAGKSSVARADAIAAARESVARRMPAGALAMTATWKQIPAFAASMTRAAVASLEADPDVIKVDLDIGGSGGLTTSVPMIGGDIVHAMGFEGAGITVAVLDSGIDSTHRDVKDALTSEACFCVKANGVGCCPNGLTTQVGAGAAHDDNGHGSNVCGIVASRGLVAGKGVASAAKLVVVKVLDATNSFSSTSQVVSGLSWIIDEHPEVRVVNMSLLTNALFSDYCDTTNAFTGAFAAAINILHDRGTVVAVCSGNNASLTQIGAPACVRNALSVGAVYKSNVGGVSALGCSDSTTAADKVTCFTNTNTTLDLLAPGAPITSDAIGGGLSTYYGTSQASPHVAGAAAVLLSINPTLTSTEVEDILRSTGKVVTDARTGRTTPRVDLLAAVSATPRPPAPGPRRRGARH